MYTIFILITVFLLKAYLKENMKITGVPETNLYFQNKKPKYKNLIIEQIKQPARVSYIMDHGTSISNTHEYCYLSYLKFDFTGDKLPQTELFDKDSMTFTTLERISPVILAAAKAYLIDRYEYLGHLN